VRTLEGPEIRPGCSGPAQLRLESGCVAAPGDRFIVRRYSPARTIAGGEVLDVLPRKHRRGEPGLVDGLRRLGSAGTRDRATIFIEQAGERGIPLPELAARCGAAPEEAREVAAALSGAGAIRVLPAEPPRAVCVAALSDLGKRCQELLAGFHAREPLKAGLPREELRVRLLPGGPVELFRAVLEDLSASGSVRLTRDVVALAAHRIELTPEERALRESIEKNLLEAGLDPPPVEQLLPSDDRARISAEKLLHLMLKEGLLHRLPDGRFLHNSVLGDLRDKLRQFRRRRELIDIASFKDLAGVTRKNAIPLLELLDAERVTLRRGNDRLILPEV
jgi:selenocysteine-specific elongation factor